MRASDRVGDRPRRAADEGVPRRAAAHRTTRSQLSTLLFADEVVDPSGVEELTALGDAEPSKRELDIAEQLIGSLAERIRARQVHATSTARACSTSSSARRRASRSRSRRAPEEAASPMPDLMSALKASLDAARAGAPEAKSAPAPRKRAAKKTAAKKPAAKKTAAAKKPAGAKKRSG